MENKCSRVGWLMEQIQKDQPSRMGKLAIWLVSLDRPLWFFAFIFVGMMILMSMSMYLPLGEFPTMYILLLGLAYLAVCAAINIWLDGWTNPYRRAQELIKIAQYQGIPYEWNCFNLYSGPPPNQYPRAWVYDGGRHLAVNTTGIRPQGLEIEEEFCNPLVDCRLMTVIPSHHQYPDQGSRVVEIRVTSARPASVGLAKEFALTAIEPTPHSPVMEAEMEKRGEMLKQTRQYNASLASRQTKLLKKEVESALTRRAGLCDLAPSLGLALKSELGKNWHFGELTVSAKSDNWPSA